MHRAVQLGATRTKNVVWSDLFHLLVSTAFGQQRCRLLPRQESASNHCVGLRPARSAALYLSDRSPDEPRVLARRLVFIMKASPVQLSPWLFEIRCPTSGRPHFERFRQKTKPRDGEAFLESSVAQRETKVRG